MRFCKRAVTLLLLLLWCLSVAASAAVTTDYVLDDGEKRPIPRPYVPVRTLSVTASTGRSLNAPQDLFLAPSGDLVVADTGNNRVLVLSPSGEVKREITEAGGLPLSKPQGVFVDELGHLFIADSSNAICPRTEPSLRRSASRRPGISPPSTCIPPPRCCSAPAPATCTPSWARSCSPSTRTTSSRAISPPISWASA